MTTTVRETLADFEAFERELPIPEPRRLRAAYGFDDVAIVPGVETLDPDDVSCMSGPDLDRLDTARASARARLEAALGDDLTRLLVGALTTGERHVVVDELDDPAA